MHPSDGAPRNLHMFCGKFFVDGELRVRQQGCKEKQPGRDCVALLFKRRSNKKKRLDYRFQFFECGEKKGFVCEIAAK